MFFAPKNSIVLPFDYAGPHSFQDFEDQIQAVKKLYRFAKLGQIVDAIKKRKRQGLASIVLENPRKGVLLQAIPVLVSLEIPFTLFVDPDYPGLNRLPLEEEMAAYHRSYPDKFSQSEFEHWQEVAGKNPLEADLFLKNSRKTLGPLPVNDLDPLYFFSTWGKLLDLPPDLVEFGLSVSHELSSKDQIDEKTSFIEKQLKTRPLLIRSPKAGFSSKELEWIVNSKFDGIVGHQEGEVTKETSVFNIPIWKLVGPN